MGLWQRSKGKDVDSEAERAIQDFEGHTLTGMPGKFSRLIYLASLRDHNTGCYHHYGLERRYSFEAVNDALRQCHERAFNDLLMLPLRDQTQDLVQFFESLQAERARLVEVWQHLRAYQILPPETCHPLAKQLFSKNVEVILQILRQSELWDLLNETHGDANHLP